MLRANKKILGVLCELADVSFKISWNKLVVEEDRASIKDLSTRGPRTPMGWVSVMASQDLQTNQHRFIVL